MIWYLLWWSSPTASSSAWNCNCPSPNRTQRTQVCRAMALVSGKRGTVCVFFNSCLDEVIHIHMPKCFGSSLQVAGIPFKIRVAADKGGIIQRSLNLLRLQVVLFQVVLLSTWWRLAVNNLDIDPRHSIVAPRRMQISVISHCYFLDAYFNKNSLVLTSFHKWGTSKWMVYD